jgi:flagellin
MALTVATNTGALTAQAAASSVNKEMETAMNRLSTGQRLNSAADDAAGVAIASRLEAQVRGLNQAIRNAGDGQALASTAEGAMVEIESMLQRMRELAVQSVSDTNSDDDRINLNKEATQLKAEIDRIVSTTQFNGKTLLDGAGTFQLQIGASAGQTMNFDVSGLGTTSLGTNGAVSATAVTSGSFKGSEAGVTQVQLAFNGNDTFSFDIDYNHGAAAQLSLTNVKVQNNSAAAISAAINTAAQNANVDNYIQATVSGNVVTIKDSYGGSLGVSGYSATANTSVNFSTINGGAGSDASAVIGTAPASTGTTFEVDGTNRAAYTAAASATAGTASVQTGDFSANGFDLTTLTSGNRIQLDVEGGAGAGGYTVSVAVDDSGTVGDLASALNAVQSDYNFTADAQTGILTATAQAVGTKTALVLTEVDTASPPAAVANSLALTLTNTDGTNATAATPESGGSNMYLDLLSADDYAFNIVNGGVTTAISFSYDGTSAGRDLVATTIGNALGNTYTVSHANGQIRIIEEAGGSFSATGFTSTAGGKIVASTDSDSGGTQGLSEILDDTSYGTAAVAATAVGTAQATDIDISFTAIDTYAFRISDGERTAVVDPTSVSAVGTTVGVAEIKAAIEYGLAAAGMTSSISVADNGDGSLTLVQSAGREVSITSFKSDAAGSMQVVSGSANTTGTAKFLDDGNASSASGVSEVNLGSSSLASDALAIIDSALNDVSSERAKLGAVMNRLDHTIASLTNVAINTEASKGRISDADFASETTNLAKAQILQQASMAMLAQANAAKQNVLSLLQG